MDRGIYPEACLGAGVLFMLGSGTRTIDIESLVFSLQELVDPKFSAHHKRAWLPPPQPGKVPERPGHLSIRSSRSESPDDPDQPAGALRSKFTDDPDRRADALRSESAYDSKCRRGALHAPASLDSGIVEIAKPAPIEQMITPRQAFLMPSHMVPKAEAVGEIAAECVAPCPPGWSILTPGARITADLLEHDSIDFVRIINKSALAEALPKLSMSSE
jgi:hypothetical protein